MVIEEVVPDKGQQAIGFDACDQVPVLVVIDLN